MRLLVGMGLYFVVVVILASTRPEKKKINDTVQNIFLYKDTTWREDSRGNRRKMLWLWGLTQGRHESQDLEEGEHPSCSSQTARASIHPPTHPPAAVQKTRFLYMSPPVKGSVPNTRRCFASSLSKVFLPHSLFPSGVECHLKAAEKKQTKKNI